jgi:hypothetical protein
MCRLYAKKTFDVDFLDALLLTQVALFDYPSQFPHRFFSQPVNGFRQDYILTTWGGK